jgi:hypothetical protein
MLSEAHVWRPLHAAVAARAAHRGATWWLRATTRPVSRSRMRRPCRGARAHVRCAAPSRSAAVL